MSRYRRFVRLATGATYAVSPREAGAYERSPNFKEVDVPTFSHVDTGRQLDVPESASRTFRDSPEFVEADSRPSVRAPKGEWVEWAVASGFDAEGLTKADLLALADE